MNVFGVLSGSFFNFWIVDDLWLHIWRNSDTHSYTMWFLIDQNRAHGINIFLCAYEHLWETSLAFKSEVSSFVETGQSENYSEQTKLLKLSIFLGSPKLWNPFRYSVPVIFLSLIHSRGTSCDSYPICIQWAVVITSNKRLSGQWREEWSYLCWSIFVARSVTEWIAILGWIHDRANRASDKLTHISIPSKWLENYLFCPLRVAQSRFEL